MLGRERRKNARYVIGELSFETNGVRHETVDISVSAVAIVRLSGVDYSRLGENCRFHSTKGAELNQAALNPHFVAQRASIVVIGYASASTDWEQVLRNNDVRADMKQLEDVFG